ncbi:MAG: hypothetical protein KKD39_03890 [Candidatus Altiarchaeota archaeon]|nr:hypothetical protein [Candidatus Altiarchaeota archaeon]
MYPKQHVITSTAAVILYGLYIGLPVQVLLVWVIVSSAVTVLLDLDHFFVILFFKKKRHVFFELLAHPLKKRKVVEVRNMLHFKGLGYVRLISHSVLIGFFYLLTKNYVIPFVEPIFVSLVVHLAADVLQTIFYPEHR